MRTATLPFVIGVFAGLAFGQHAQSPSVDRVFHFTNVQAPQGRQEIANLIRAITNIQQAAMDNGAGVLAVSGTAGQIALAEWLFAEMDKPAAGPDEYRVPGSSDDVVRVFHLAHTGTPQAMQEIINTIRSLADVQRIMAISSLKAVTMRGTVAQMATTGWLIDQLDKPAGTANSGVREYSMKDGAKNAALRVIYPKYADTPQTLTELVNSIRTISGLQRVTLCTASKAIALRGVTEQAALAEWLVSELDKPATAPAPGPDAREYRASEAPYNVVRVIHPTRVESPQHLQEVASMLRATTGIQQMYVYNATKALAMRGTGDQMARVEQLLKERDK